MGRIDNFVKSRVIYLPCVCVCVCVWGGGGGLLLTWFDVNPWLDK